MQALDGKKMGTLYATVGAAALVGYSAGFLIVPLAGLAAIAIGVATLMAGPPGKRWPGLLLLTAGPVLILERVVARGRLTVHPGIEVPMRVAGPTVAVAMLVAGLWLRRRAARLEPIEVSLEDRRSGRRRLFAAVGLFFLAPVCAEYIQAYDDSTGNLPILLGNLVVFGPLYGAPALLIREIAGRRGLRWPGILLLAAAFGLAQTALVDHSLFNDSYRDIDYWEEALRPTFIPALGIAAAMAVNFVIGHLIWSFSVPIAVVQSFQGDRRTEPWLGPVGLAVTVVLYLAAVTLVAVDSVRTENFLPSPGRLVGSALMIALLVLAAYRTRRYRLSPLPGTAPRPLLVGAAAYLLTALVTLVELALYLFGLEYPLSNRWPGVALYIAAYGSLGALLLHWSRLQTWGGRHVLAAAAGALLIRLSEAFLSQPLGDVPLALKLAHNIGFALAAVLLLSLASRQTARA